MKKIICFIVCAFAAVSCAKEWDSGKTFLTETSVKSFIENHKMILTELKTENISKGAFSETFVSTEKALIKILRGKVTSKAKQVFKKYGLDSKAGHIQIAVMQLGIYAYTIEQALTECTALERSAEQIIADKQMETRLKDFKNFINAKDYELIVKYNKELFEIFDNIEKP